jgi:hypothetical protein
MSESLLPERVELLSLRFRVDELEARQRELYDLVRDVEGLPGWDEWRAIRLKVAEPWT